MERLTLNRIEKEFLKAKSILDEYWNDVEIHVGGRNIRALYTTSPKDAFDRWKEETNGEYRHISVRLNNIDDYGDIQDVKREFEFESGT